MVISIALCSIPLVTFYLCFALLVKDFKKLIGLLACLLGLVAFIPIMAIDFLKDGFFDGTSQFSQFVRFLGLALVEEGIKMILLFFLPSKKSTQAAFIAYSVLAGMTLGCFETLLYLIVFVTSTNVRWWAIIIHMTCSCLSGIFVYSIKKKNILIMPFVFAVLFHGVYNYFVDFRDIRRYFAIAVILIALVECKLRYSILKSDLADANANNSMSKNFGNKKISKGDSKNMGIKDLLGKLFGKKDDGTEKDLPEQTVFNSTTVSSSGSNSDKTIDSTEEKDEGFSSTLSSSDALQSSLSVSSEEKVSDSGFKKYPEIDKLFNEEDVPEPVKAEPKVEVKVSAAEKTVDSAKATADAPKTSTRGRKPAAAKATTDAPKTSTRGRKPAAAKATADAPKASTRGRKPAAAKANDTIAEVKATAKKTTAAAKTTAKKAATTATTAAKKTATAAKTTAKKAATTATTAAKKTTAAAKTTAKKAATTATTAAKKTATAAKTTAKKAATTATTAAKKTTAAAKTTAKKATTTAKKTTTTKKTK